jgi:methionyl aminopeptidase
MSRFQILTQEQIKDVREGGKILKECLEHVSSCVREGVTTLELDRIAEEFIRSRGGVPTFKGYRGFPATLCVSINDECVHGIPGDRVLKDGDLVSLDGGVTYRGLVTDSATTVILGDVPPEVRRFVSVSKQALEAGCSVIRSAHKVGDISAKVQETVEGAGFHCLHALTGHGLGNELHQYPDIPNVGEAHTGPMLPAYSLIAIEPITSMGTDRIREGEDGWTLKTWDGSLAAHFEHTVLVLPEGREIIV